MKAKIRNKYITKNEQQCQLHQSFTTLLNALERLPDAAAVGRNPLRSAPPERILMVF